MTINGKEITLYYPNGKTIQSIEEFIEFYSNCYYLYNNREVEDVIVNIVEKGINSELELFKVLAWVFTKIDMDKSKSERFIYKNGFNEEDMQLQIPRKSEIINKSDLVEICDIIKKHSENCNSDKKAQNFLDKLKTTTDGKGWGKHFGSVYMISLLYFVSNGKYPIVNSSSYMALEAIHSKIPYGERKYFPGLVGRKDTKFGEIITKGNYAKYIDRLKDFSKIVEKPDLRSIDQALWTYGKLFKKS